MTLHDAMIAACDAVGIAPPRFTKPGEWVKTPVKGKRRGNGSGRVLIFDDGRGGIAWNWVTQQQQRFTDDGLGDVSEVKAPRPDPEAVRRAEREQAEVECICTEIVRAATPQEHPYLAAKGFPDEQGLSLTTCAPSSPNTSLARPSECACRKATGLG